jgi:GT2 family glycosyltransferase
MDWSNIYASHVGVDEVDKGQYNKMGITDFATGCCMLIKSSVFRKVGLLNEKYFLYWEDIDFCVRAKKKKILSFYCPQAFIFHKNAESSSVGSNIQDYYQTRNRLLFGFYYAAYKVKASLFKQSIKRLITGRKWEKKGIVDFYLNRFYKQGFDN